MSDPIQAHSTGEQLVIPLIREEASVGTRVVDTGRGVRVNKTVAESRQLVEQALRHEHVEVRRVAIDRTVTPEEAPLPRYEGETFIVPVLEEILVVEKRVRIKEEIHLVKTIREEQHSETVVLRSEQVDVQRFDESDVS